jgi:hypothetical protein
VKRWTRYKKGFSHYIDIKIDDKQKNLAFFSTYGWSRAEIR